MLLYAMLKIIWAEEKSLSLHIQHTSPSTASAAIIDQVRHDSPSIFIYTISVLKYKKF